jgi:hypothetical protein
MANKVVKPRLTATMVHKEIKAAGYTMPHGYQVVKRKVVKKKATTAKKKTSKKK